MAELAGSIQFFLYDVIKITLLLCILIFIISYIQSYFPPGEAAEFWGGFTGSEQTSSLHFWGR